MSDENNTVEGQINTDTTTEGTTGEETTTEETTLLTQKQEFEGETEGTTENQEGEKPPVETAPDSYADYEIPEGFSLDKDMVANFNKVAKELNLTQAQAQKIMNVAVDHSTKLAKEENEAFSKKRQEWVSNLKSDKEFGGDNFKGTILKAQKVLNKFGSEDLNKFLVQSGAGDNDEVIKFLARIGARISEDTMVDGKPTVQPKSAAEVIYGTNN